MSVGYPARYLNTLSIGNNRWNPERTVLFAGEITTFPGILCESWRTFKYIMLRVRMRVYISKIRLFCAIWCTGHTFFWIFNLKVYSVLLYDFYVVEVLIVIWYCNILKTVLKSFFYITCYMYVQPNEFRASLLTCYMYVQCMYVYVCNVCMFI